jgi:hypothetical protein
LWHRPGKAEQVGHQLAVEGQRHAVAGGGAQRRAVVDLIGRHQQVHVVQQHLGEGGGPQADRAGHGGLHVRAADHGNAVVLLREIEQRAGQRGRLADGAQQLVAPVQAQVEGHLVVAAAAGVNPLAEIAQPLGQRALDGEVHILIGQRDGEAAGLRVAQHLHQAGDDLLALGRGE